MREMISTINRWIAKGIIKLLDLIYIRALERYIGRETVRYFICGVLNYIVLDAMIYYAIYHYIVDISYVYLGSLVISPHIAALIVTFPLTFLSGFWLNRYVAFQATTPKASSQIVRYALSVGGSIIISYISLKWLVEGVGIWATPAKITSSIITSLYSYLMARFYTFRRG